VYVNDEGGEAGEWTETELTTWTTESPDDIICRGDFIMVVNGAESLPLARSIDGGTNFTYLSGNTDMASHALAAIDAIHQDFLIAVGADGYVYLSDDGGDTWTTVDAGDATTENLTKVWIVRTNPSVVYALGANNALIKSENGGYSWFALTGPSASDALVDIVAPNEYDVLVLNDDAELWYSTDGGTTWTEMADLPQLVTTPVGVAMAACNCGTVHAAGTLYVAVKDGSSAAHKIYRNAGWGSGQFEIEQSCDDLPEEPADMMCCHSNLAMVVGGDGSTYGWVGLLS
jgi:photosystem II stability/assembly factor-like uncharacterized protein